MRKLAYSILLIVIIAIGLVFVNGVTIGKAQASTSLSGILSSDTICTNENSPYNLIGNVFVNNGVTLTIEPGATINFNGYYLMINGTLTARGTDTDKIQLNLGYIIFREGSTPWDSQTNTGCTIENANLDTIKTQSASPKISNNSFYAYNVSSEAIYVNGGSPIISGNNIMGAIIVNGSPIVSNNTVTSLSSAAIFNVGGSPLIEGNIITAVGGWIPDVIAYSWTIITGAVMIDEGSPSFVDNIINGIVNGADVAIGCSGGSLVTLSNNTIFGGVGSVQIPFNIENNTINGTLTIGNNGYNPSYPANIQTTLISNNLMDVEIDEGSVTIQNNIVNGDITLGTVVAVGAGPATTYTLVNALIENNSITGSINYQSNANSTIHYNKLAN